EPLAQTMLPPKMRRSRPVYERRYARALPQRMCAGRASPGVYSGLRPRGLRNREGASGSVSPVSRPPKEWLTIFEAARHLAGACGAAVSTADVLRLALEGKVRLSVNFINPA